MNVSSEKNSLIDDRPLARLYILIVLYIISFIYIYIYICMYVYIKNKSGPEVDPFETTANIGNHIES